MFLLEEYFSTKDQNVSIFPAATLLSRSSRFSRDRRVWKYLRTSLNIIEAIKGSSPCRCNARNRGKAFDDDVKLRNGCALPQCRIVYTRLLHQIACTWIRLRKCTYLRVYTCLSIYRCASTYTHYSLNRVWLYVHVCVCARGSILVRCM